MGVRTGVGASQAVTSSRRPAHGRCQISRSWGACRTPSLALLPGSRGRTSCVPDNRRTSAREISRAGRTRTSASCSRSRGAAVEHHGPNACSSSTGTRTPVSALRGRRPGQLADGARTSARPWNRTTSLRHIRPTGRPPTPAAHVQLPARDSNSHDRLNTGGVLPLDELGRNGERPDGESNSDLLFDREVSVPVDDRGGIEPVGIEPTHARLRARYAAFTSRLRSGRREGRTPTARGAPDGFRDRGRRRLSAGPSRSARHESNVRPPR